MVKGEHESALTDEAIIRQVMRGTWMSLWN